MQTGLEGFCEAVVAAAVEVCCSFRPIRVPVSVMPGQRCAEIVAECVDGCTAAGRRLHVAAVGEQVVGHV